MVTASPSGTQVIFDGENPRSFTGVATANILDGMLVVTNAGQSAQAVGATVSTFDGSTDIELLPIKDSDHVNGLAVTTVNSGTTALVTVNRQGTYIFRAAGIISGGQGIVGVSGTSQGVRGESPNVSWSGTKIGTAMTNSASGTNLYVLASINI